MVKIHSRRIHAALYGNPCRTADRLAGIRLLKHHAVRSQTVQIRRQIQIRIVAAAGVPPLLIRKNNRIFGLLLIFFPFLCMIPGPYGANLRKMYGQVHTS